MPCIGESTKLAPELHMGFRFSVADIVWCGIRSCAYHWDLSRISQMGMLVVKVPKPNQAGKRSFCC